MKITQAEGGETVVLVMGKDEWRAMHYAMQTLAHTPTSVIEPQGRVVWEFWRTAQSLALDVRDQISDRR